MPSSIEGHSGAHALLLTCQDASRWQSAGPTERTNQEMRLLQTSHPGRGAMSPTYLLSQDLGRQFAICQPCILA